MTSPATLMNIWKLRPKKQLGQNYLADPSTAEMIVLRSGLLPEDVVLEIGAGLGALTVPLSRVARKVYAVEKDGHLMDVLNTVLASSRCGNVKLLNENILDVDLQHLAEIEGCKMVVFGNLPYNISSQILVYLMASRAAVRHCVLMLQKELAQRILSKPGRKAYGRLSVLLQYCADITRIAEIKATVFYPKPKVDSEVIGIRFRAEQQFLANDEVLFSRVVKAAFSKRRKTLKNALTGSELALDATTAGRVLERAGIDPVRRAETLNVTEFVTLSNTLGRYSDCH